MTEDIKNINNIVLNKTKLYAFKSIFLNKLLIIIARIVNPIKNIRFIIL